MKTDNCCTPTNCFKYGFAGALFFVLILLAGWAGYNFGIDLQKKFEHRVVLTIHSGDIIETHYGGRTRDYYVSQFGNEKVSYIRADNYDDFLMCFKEKILGYMIGVHYTERHDMKEPITITKSSKIVGHLDPNLIEVMEDFQ